MIDKFRFNFRLPKSSIVNTYGLIAPKPKDPSQSMGDLLSDVQTQRVYLDGKTFVDLVPRRNLTQIKKDYHLERADSNFNLREFIENNFYSLGSADKFYQTEPDTTMSDHINKLWPILGRQNHRDRGSLLALPHPYTVPGGRFSEQFYWDSYFIMLGLKSSNRWKDIENMMKNYTYMIRKFGFIPTANRNYFLTRSQPPFFSHMVELLAEYRGKSMFVQYLPYLQAEYSFWMKGKNLLQKSNKFQAYRRVVKMPDGEILNRYYDDSDTPRPESFHEDIATASTKADRSPNSTYVHLRAAAESGWDFSSRWFADPMDLSSIETTDFVPVDLNSLLYHLELTIAKGYRILKNPLMTKKFEALADKRADAINKYLWHEGHNFYVDYNFAKSKQSDHLTLASTFPLFVRLASKEQAEGVASLLRNDFLRGGGLVSTLIKNDQQWDNPNGWAPLQWVAIKGLRNYNHDELASEVKKRWLNVNEKVFQSKGKMIEKYDVVDPSGVGGGGEYPLQDGFGWTNGVALALINEDIA